MSYKTVITFPEQTTYNSETIQVILTFTHNLTGSDRAWSAADKGLKIVKYGDRKFSYDISEPLLAVQEYNLDICDSLGELNSLFFGTDTISLATDKRAEIKVLINGIVKFIGNIIEDGGIDYDDSKLTVSLKVLPNTEILNKEPVYDKNNNPRAITLFGYLDGTFIPVTQIFSDIYKKVDSACALSIINNFRFWGMKNASFKYPHPDIPFDCCSFNIHDTYYNNTMGIKSLGDVLRSFAEQFCSFTGMATTQSAFLKRLFVHDPNNIQTIQKVLTHKKGYKYSLVDYVEVDSNIGDPGEPYTHGVYSVLEERRLEKTLLVSCCMPITSGTAIHANVTTQNYFCFNITRSGVYVLPQIGDLYTQNSSRFRLVELYDDTITGILGLVFERVNGTNDPQASGTLTGYLNNYNGDTYISFNYWEHENGEYYCFKARDPNILSGAWYSYAYLISYILWNFRGNIQNCRVDKFKFLGSDYDFLKDFIYNGSIFQPISMTMRDSDYATDCEALYLGEVAA